MLKTSAVSPPIVESSTLLEDSLTPSRSWEWPKRKDPRIPFACLLTTYCVLGFTFLGFNRSPIQMLSLIVSGCLLDMLLAKILKGRRIIPLSAYISCCSLGLLLNYSHYSWMLFFPVFMTILSKYLLTCQGRHIFNPSLFGVCTSLLLTNELVTAAPAYQWAGGHITMSAFVVMGAVSLFIFRVGRGWLIVSFLFFYALQTALRAYIMRHHIPAEMLFIGTVASPAFFLFTFYMMTDPATSPKSRKGQVWLGFGIAFLDLYLHTKESVFTFFYAAFIISWGKFFWLHLCQLYSLKPKTYFQNLFATSKRRHWGLVVLLVLAFLLRPSITPYQPGFKMERLSASHTGLYGEMSNILTAVDPRLLHISKWVMSTGDAVAVGDVDQDGFLDIFLTNVLKKASLRNALYRNLGNMKFERVPLPALDRYQNQFKQDGVVSGATFVDYDGDGDQDLVLAVAWGDARILKNQLQETGSLSFSDVTSKLIPAEHTVSLGITFFDYNKDANLDMFIANALLTHFPGYKEPKEFNLFKLPEPEYKGDRRMFPFMHNGWHNADNGGLNVLYQGQKDGSFVKQDIKALGINETRWSLAVGTADFNKDGFTDLYIANDFGPDNLYLNMEGKKFVSQKGKWFGEIGRDTYKGMNCSIADFDRNGFQDIYISNVHHSLQAEGSLLWMTRPNEKDRFVPNFTDEATQRGVLNERRFGWGADAGDLNNDGWVDLVQANGMVDDRLDPMYDSGKDYLYVNHKLMQSAPNIHAYADMWGDIRGRTIYPNEARRAYLNMGWKKDVSFIDVAKQIGIDDPDNSRGVALSDLDNDGDLDLIITNQHGPVSLYRNNLRQQSKKANFIGLSLFGNGTDTHRSAIGTQVWIEYQENGKKIKQLAEVSLLSGFSSQGDPRLHFGLGAYNGSVEITIHWYGGRSEKRTLLANNYYKLDQKK